MVCTRACTLAHDLFPLLTYTLVSLLKAGSLLWRWLSLVPRLDADSSVALCWCWNRLDFYSSIASPALASFQPIRLSKIWHEKNSFFPLILTMVTMLVALALYCEPGLLHLYISYNNYVQCTPLIHVHNSLTHVHTSLIHTCDSCINYESS